MSRLKAAWRALLGKTPAVMGARPPFAMKSSTMYIHYAEIVRFTVESETSPQWVEMEVVDSEGSSFYLTVFGVDGLPGTIKTNWVQKEE